MRLGTSWCLLTVGAVLAYAVHLDLDVVDVAVLGRILVVVGVLGAVVELTVVRPRARAARTGTGQHPVPVRPLAPNPRTSWAPGETRPFTPVRRPHQES